MINKHVLFLVSIMSVLVLLAACAQQTAQEPVAEQTLKVGAMLPLTGDAATYGESIQKGIELAFADQGITNVEIIYEDTRCSAKDAVTAITKLISADKVIAIVGDVCSGATLGAAPIAEENQIPLISPSSTSPEITTAGEYIYRTIPSDALQGVYGANLIAEMGYTKLAVLYGNEDYGVGFVGVLQEAFPGEGKEIVASEAYERGSVDLRTQLTKIKEAGPDAIYIISNSEDSSIAALKQIEELGIDAHVFGSEGLMSEGIASLSASEGLTITSVSSGSVSFKDAHSQEYESQPGPFAAQGYDGLKAIALAIKQGASTGPEVKSFLDTMEYDGATGTIVFDENGDVEGNYDVLVVKDGEYMAKE